MLQQGVLLADRYELDERIGRGGMADVYRGRDRVLDRPVAVKVIVPHLVREESSIRRLRREARLAAGLNHPNVVAVYDAVLHDHASQAIVMELLPGQSLSDVIVQRAPLEVGEAVRLIEGVTVGLQAAHAAGLVHRDVKPSNVLLDQDGTPKLADFGIARAVDGTASTTTVHGSVSYVAPEQIRGLTSNGRADLYAVGCMLFELLTGRPPFGGSPAEIVSGHLEMPAPSVASLRPDVPPVLDRLVERLLSKNPELRPQNAEEVRATLRAVLEPPVDTAAMATAAEGDSEDQGDAVVGASLVGGAFVEGTDLPQRRFGRRQLLQAAALGAVVMLAALTLVEQSDLASGSSAEPLEAVSVSPTPEASVEVDSDVSPEPVAEEEGGEQPEPQAEEPAPDPQPGEDAPPAAGNGNPGRGEADPPGRAVGHRKNGGGRG